MRNIRKFSRFPTHVLQVFSHALKLTIIWTFETLCCVVEILLLGRAGSLPSYARILSGLI